MGPGTLRKQILITLVCPAQPRRSALVGLTRTTVGAKTCWTAATSVEDGGQHVAHVTDAQIDERSALVEIADWLRRRFGASTTCYGGTVTIVGVSPASEAA